MRDSLTGFLFLFGMTYKPERKWTLVFRYFPVFLFQVIGYMGQRISGTSRSCFSWMSLWAKSIYRHTTPWRVPSILQTCFVWVYAWFQVIHTSACFVSLVFGKENSSWQSLQELRANPSVEDRKRRQFWKFAQQEATTALHDLLFLCTFFRKQPATLKWLPFISRFPHFILWLWHPSHDRTTLWRAK